ncbi:glycoside hydrolase family 3 N-terminal domain-containing protein [Serinicoccus marinus]|uniref:glycoside hydrolase family 3 N-terminal domain-containing protein n=1 Tax=Serinicoccus marinus TaxID=247333 RepID=UPI0003B5EEF8|nr:glycoside hydrolase family 3 N-terminal domain-containing protein [Serinicoccus marinus]
MNQTDLPAGDDLRRDALGVLAPGFVGTTLPPWLEQLLDEGLGGVWLFGHNVEDEAQVRALTDAVHGRRAEALVCADEEGGTVTRLHHAEGSPWPGAWALGVVDDAEATRTVYRGLGEQLAAAGIDLTAAPDADVNTEPDNPVIGVRSFGADAGLAARHVSAAVAGLAEAGVASCAKHFPGHGSTTLDSHLDLPVLDVDPQTLTSRELVPFRAAVDAGTDAIMTGHLVVPGHGDLPATLNPALLGMLREELGLTGVICTDALDMAAVADRYGREHSAVLALAAGADLLCIGNPVFPGDYDAAEDTVRLVEAVVAAVRDGELSAARLAEAAGRVRALGARQAARRAGHGRGDGGAAADGGDPTSQPREAPDDLGQRVASRAVRVTGVGGSLSGADVVALSRRGNIASGARQEVVSEVLAQELSGRVRTPDQTVDEAVDDVTAGTDRGPLVLVSDDHSEWDDPTIRGLLGRADALVHTGIRDLPADLAVPRVVRTYGGGRVSALAGATALRGLGGEP